MQGTPRLPWNRGSRPLPLARARGSGRSLVRQPDRSGLGARRRRHRLAGPASAFGASRQARLDRIPSRGFRWGDCGRGPAPDRHHPDGAPLALDRRRLRVSRPPDVVRARRRPLCGARALSAASRFRDDGHVGGSHRGAASSDRGGAPRSSRACVAGVRPGRRERTALSGASERRRHRRRSGGPRIRLDETLASPLEFRRGRHSRRPSRLATDGSTRPRSAARTRAGLRLGALGIRLDQRGRAPAARQVRSLPPGRLASLARPPRRRAPRRVLVEDVGDARRGVAPRFAVRRAPGAGVSSRASARARLAPADSRSRARGHAGRAELFPRGAASVRAADAPRSLPVRGGRLASDQEPGGCTFVVLVAAARWQRQVLDREWGRIEAPDIRIAQTLPKGALPMAQGSVLRIRVAPALIPSNAGLSVLGPAGEVLYDSRADPDRRRPFVEMPLSPDLLAANQRGPVTLTLVSAGDYGESQYLLFPVIPAPWGTSAEREGSSGPVALDRPEIRKPRLVGGLGRASTGLTRATPPRLRRRRLLPLLRCRSDGPSWPASARASADRRRGPSARRSR